MIRLVTDDLRPPGDPPKRHLLSVGDLTRDDVERLLGTAEHALDVVAREVRDRQQVALHGDTSTSWWAMVTASTPSSSSTRTFTRSSRAVGRFLPT